MSLLFNMLSRLVITFLPRSKCLLMRYIASVVVVGGVFFIYFGGSKTTADGDCSHEIKRCLLLGRKATTNIDSILRSRNITLPTKVHLVKVMVFPGAVYGCESWTIKKAKCQRIDAFELWF